MQISIDNQRLQALCDQAEQSERRRAHLCLHQEHSDPVQRLYIATQPGTYAQPHRHLNGDKWEYFALVKGKLSLLTFDEQGRVSQRFEFSEGQQHSVTLTPDTWHSFVCHEADSVFFEIKPGPFIPVAEENFAAWAPKENTEGAAAFEEWMRSAKVGESYPA